MIRGQIYRHSRGLTIPARVSINTNFDFVEYPHISNDPIIRDSAAIAVTGAHEFNHAIQLGYRIWFEGNGQILDRRFLESSATYMEEVLHDEVNDYHLYLPQFYRNTQRHFGDQNILYGDAIFHVMAGDIYGKTITRENLGTDPQRAIHPGNEYCFSRKRERYQC